MFPSPNRPLATFAHSRFIGWLELDDEGELPLSQDHQAVLRRPARHSLSTSLRTDSVNRGFCISRFTLAIFVLLRVIKFLFFFIPKL